VSVCQRRVARRECRCNGGTLRLVTISTILVVALVACKRGPTTPEAAPRPPVDETVEAVKLRAAPPPSREVTEVCSKHHAYVPPHALPRGLWIEEVVKMFKLSEAPYNGVHERKAERIMSWYLEKAPAEWPLYRGRSAQGSGRLRLVPNEFAAAKEGDLPGGSNVNLTHLLDDGLPELLLTDMRDGGVRHFRPSRSAEGFKLLATLKHPCRTAVIDFDGDGARDILVAELGSYLPTNEKVGAAIWLRGDGKGGFEPVTLVEDVGRVADVQAADFDLDGDLDVVVASFGHHKAGRILVLETRPSEVDGTYSFLRRTMDPRTGAVQVEVADLNGDGLPDFMALLAQEHESVVAFINKGGMVFEPRTVYKAPHAAWGSTGMDLVDLDKDGDLDVLVTNGDTMDVPAKGQQGETAPWRFLFPQHGVRWLENQGGYPFVPHDLAQLYGAHSAKAGDMDGDGDLDVVVSAFLPEAPYQMVRVPYDLESLIWLEQTTPGNFTRRTLRSIDSEIPTLDLGDIDGDGDIDVVTGHLYLERLRPGQRDVSLTVWLNALKKAPR
jgi:hypothetical protein